MINDKRIKTLMASIFCLVCVVIIVLCINIGKEKENSGNDSEGINVTEEAPVVEETETETEVVTKEGFVLDEDGKFDVGDTKFLYGYEADIDDDTVKITKKDTDITSKYVVLINASTNKVVAGKNSKKRISPASMTKILTVLVAAEQIEKNENLSLDDKFKITVDITDYAYVNDCSTVGFKKNEVVPVKDLFYGTILPSGGEAAVALATYVAGSQEEFVKLMNDKLEELGLADTAHFTNCVGLYDEDHYCSVYDMAMILKAAVQNDFARDVLSTHVYTTTKNKKHKKGITISNLFLRRIEDYETNGTVLCAKTGFVNQSGSCAASYQISDSGVPYICVTGNTYSSWRCIYDHIAVYSQYTK